MYHTVCYLTLLFFLIKCQWFCECPPTHSTVYETHALRSGFREPITIQTLLTTPAFFTQRVVCDCGISLASPFLENDVLGVSFLSIEISSCRSSNSRVKCFRYHWGIISIKWIHGKLCAYVRQWRREAMVGERTTWRKKFIELKHRSIFQITHTND